MKTTLYLHIFTRPLKLCKIFITFINIIIFILYINYIYFGTTVVEKTSHQSACTLFMIIFTHSDLTMLENNELFVDSSISTNFTTLF